MRYTLYSGAGNRFALLDSPLSAHWVPQLCEQCAVDGVIFAENTFRMRTFNRDGSEAEMCGNGLRCFIQYLIDRGIRQKSYEIETLAGLHRAWVEGDQIVVELPPIQEVRWNLIVEGHTVHLLNTGVPHAVLFVDCVENLEVERVGPTIRYHPLFPEGTNVNFVQLNPLRVRTYERGVERETLACGTGVIASALAAAYLFNLPSPICIQVQSGDSLKISFTSDWKNVRMEGPAIRLGEGTFSLNESSFILAPS